MRSIAALVLVVLLACGSPSGSFGEADRAAIASVLAEQAAAWNRGDLDGFMAAYERSDALVFTSGAEVQRGWQGTYDRYVTRYRGAGANEMGNLAFEVLDVRGLGADGAVVLGTWTLTDTPKAGTGIFSLAFVRTAEGWRIVHDHTSAKSPAK
jgi:uncharacterized protein (TIGR02246 family)